MKKIIIFSVSAFLYLPLFVFSKQIIGIYETVSLPTKNLVLRAKVDSGATNSSLHAVNIKRYYHHQREWVSFDTVNENGNVVSLSAIVKRTAKIKRHDGNSQERPVIEIGLCIGSIFREAEVNLIDRSMFDYSLLIGRSYLEGNFLIDVSIEYSAKPDC